MHNNDEIEDILKNLLSNNLLIEKSEILDDSDMNSGIIALDDLDKIEFIMDIERHFDIFVPDDEIDVCFESDWKTFVERIIKHIKK